MIKNIRTIVIVVVLLTVQLVNAQETTDEFAKDIATMLEVNGSAKTYDLVFNQMVMQMKATMPNVPDSAWADIKTEVFDEQIKALNKQLIPIYQKHFTHEDVKAIIAFYQTEAGKNLAAKTPLVTQESMAIGQQWGMGLSMAVQSYLRENGIITTNLIGVQK